MFNPNLSIHESEKSEDEDSNSMKKKSEYAFILGQHSTVEI